ncbi:MAG: class I SAM-dependent methyltransferase [Candidatus Peregrinibacteria bacterium]
MKNYQRAIIGFYAKNKKQFIEHTEPLQNTSWLKKFCAFLPPKGKVLDLGCAFGRDCHFFVDRGFKTYGVDLSSDLIQEAKKRIKGAIFRVADMTNLKGADSFFDGIWCNATLLHLKKAEVPRAIQEMWRVLKNNGFLYLGLKKGKGEKVDPDRRYKNDKRFFSYFEKEEINALLIRHGFKIIESKAVHLKNRYTKDWIFLIAKKVMANT